MDRNLLQVIVSALVMAAVFLGLFALLGNIAGPLGGILKYLATAGVFVVIILFDDVVILPTMRKIFDKFG